MTIIRMSVNSRGRAPIVSRRQPVDDVGLDRVFSAADCDHLDMPVSIEAHESRPRQGRECCDYDPSDASGEICQLIEARTAFSGTARHTS
ncbi:hypothetical protein Misp02_70730 [Microtetraspora sp. NBRC 16547]|nr:hypothetical protein [Microtetraspora sp. NBRC 16547]GLX02987.1 hypothetical protein Misp02_70730 [Microtetraspora sp. NBRC 16547]